jgi:hypothetical protein
MEINYTKCCCLSRIMTKQVCRLFPIQVIYCIIYTHGIILVSVVPALAIVVILVDCIVACIIVLSYFAGVALALAGAGAFAGAGAVALASAGTLAGT